jgi:hypothetical protein
VSVCERLLLSAIPGSSKEVDRHNPQTESMEGVCKSDIELAGLAVEPRNKVNSFST